MTSSQSSFEIVKSKNQLSIVTMVPRRKVGRHKKMGSLFIVASTMMTFLGCTEDGLYEAYIPVRQMKSLKQGMAKADKKLGYRFLIWWASRYRLDTL